MKIHAFAALKPKGSLQPFDYDVKELGPKEVLIKVSHCGICHSDVHLLDGDWGKDIFPLVPGHEVVGTVEKLGDEVRHLKKGQRVGVGWQCGSCFACEWCEKGEENLCSGSKATCRGHHGGFAAAVVVDARFAFPIPKELDSAKAAPLLCGGITVFSPLRRLGGAAPKRVGVVGIGGLGHFALQFGRAMGHEVTAFSTSPAKEAEAKRLGAHRFVLTGDKKAMTAAKGSLDLIVSTVNVHQDWNKFISILRPNGTLCTVGALPGDMSLSPTALLVDQKSVAGSVIGGRPMIEEMLSFAGRHNVGAQAEIVPLSKVNEVIDKVRRGKARYRIVLEC